LRYAFIIVGGLIALVVLAVVLVLVLVDPNDFKGDIARAVHTQTNRTLTFQGDLSLSVFPWIGVETGGLSLSNAPGFGDEPFASLDHAEIKVKLLPLLSKNLEVGQVVLEGLDLNLVKNEQGVTNWKDLAQAGPSNETAPADAGPGPGEQEPPPAAAVAVGGVKVQDARISWRDMQAGKSYVVHDLDLDVGNVAQGEPTDVTLSMKLTSEQPALAMDAAFSGEVLAKLREQAVEVKGMDVTVTAQGEALKGGEATVKLAGDVFADADDKAYRVEGMQLDASATGGAVPGKKLEAKLTCEAKADLQAGTATVSDLVLTAYNLRLTGGVQASALLVKPRATVNLRVAPFDAKKLLAGLGKKAPKTADPQALRKVALQTVVEYGPSSVMAKDLILTLDETTAKGHVGVENLDKPSYQAALKVDAIDVDRYLPPAGKGGEAEPAAETKKPGEQAEAGLPLDALRELDCDAVLDVGRLQVKKLTFTEVHVEVHAKDGVVKIKPAKLSGYGGALASGLVLDVRDKTPKANLDASLAGLRLKPMLTDLTGQAKAQGVVNLGANLATQGMETEELLRHLNGKANFKMKNGKIADFNPVRILRNAVAVVRGGSKTGSAPSDMADVSGSARFKNGVAYNKDLKARSPLFRGAGQGAVDLAGKTIDYVLETSLVASVEGQGGADVSELIGVTVPIRIQGNLADPGVGVDMEQLARILVTSGVNNVEDLVKGVGEGLKGLGDQLRGGQPQESGDKKDSDSKKFRPQDLIKGLF
jgi:AsmA protein